MFMMIKIVVWPIWPGSDKLIWHLADSRMPSVIGAEWEGENSSDTRTKKYSGSWTERSEDCSRIILLEMEFTKIHECSFYHLALTEHDDVCKYDGCVVLVSIILLSTELWCYPAAHFAGDETRLITVSNIHRHREALIRWDRVVN